MIVGDVDETETETIERLLWEAGQDRAKITLLSGLLRKAIDLMPSHLPSCEIYETGFCTCGYSQFRKNAKAAIAD